MENRVSPSPSTERVGEDLHHRAANGGSDLHIDEETLPGSRRYSDKIQDDRPSRLADPAWGSATKQAQSTSYNCQQENDDAGMYKSTIQSRE